MKRLSSIAGALTALFLAALACSGRGNDEQSTKDNDGVQGIWEVVSAESNGEPAPPGLLDGAHFVFSGNRLTLMGKDGTFRLDASKNPKQVEFVRGKVKQVGIYELSADELKLCVGPEDDPATDFVTKPHTDHSSFVLRRKH